MNSPWFKRLVWGVALLGVVAIIWLLPIGEYAIRLIDYVRGAGAVGVVVYVVAYVVATVLLLPGSVLTLGAGFVFGVVWGALLVWPTSVLAAVIAFSLGRSAVRDRVEHKLLNYPRLRALDLAIRDSDVLVIVLLRLSPIVPFNLLNYGLAVTKARFWPYVVATTFGMVPGILLYVSLGSAVTSLTQLSQGAPSGGTAGTALLLGGLVATLVVTLVLSRLAKRKLAAMSSASSDAASASPRDTA